MSVLSRLYHLTDATPGRHDVLFFRVLLVAGVLGALTLLIRAFMKLRTKRRHHLPRNVKTPAEAISSGREPAPADTEAEAARGRLRVPAVGLIISGSANFLLLALGLTLWLTVAWVEPPGRPAVLGLIVLAMASVVGIVIMLGGWHMIRLRSFSWALVASILALLPLSAGFMLGFPMGVWALVVLYRSDVQAAFAAKRQGVRSR